MSALRLLAVLSTIGLVASGAAQTVIPVGQFRSVELHDGGQVILRHGQTQRVTLLSGDLRCTQVRLAGGQRLVIDNHGGECPRHHRLQVEVITPEIEAVSVSNGGTLQSVGAFPVRPAIEADVEQGGTIDIRSIPADAVDASVHSGGRIFTSPRETLTATINSGGGITYWGDARVRQSVRHGGAVSKGTPADADQPLSQLAQDCRPFHRCRRCAPSARFDNLASLNDGVCLGRRSCGAAPASGAGGSRKCAARRESPPAEAAGAPQAPLRCLTSFCAADVALASSRPVRRLPAGTAGSFIFVVAKRTS